MREQRMCGGWRLSGGMRGLSDRTQAAVGVLVWFCQTHARDGRLWDFRRTGKESWVYFSTRRSSSAEVSELFCSRFYI